VVYFPPYLCCTPQGMREKRGKFRVIFDASTQSYQHEKVWIKWPTRSSKQSLTLVNQKCDCTSVFITRESASQARSFILSSRNSQLASDTQESRPIWQGPSVSCSKTILPINESRFWIQHFRKFMGTILACDQEQYSHLFFSGSHNQAQGPPQRSKMGWEPSSAESCQSR